MANVAAPLIKRGFMEYSIAEGSLPGVGPVATEAFLRDHLRLNPHCKWAQKKLRGY